MPLAGRYEHGQGRQQIISPKMHGNPDIADKYQVSKRRRVPTVSSPLDRLTNQLSPNNMNTTLSICIIIMQP